MDEAQGKFRMLSVEDLLELEPPARVKRDGERVVLDGWYEIRLKDCNTHRKVVAWIAHLAEKNWVDAELIGQFIAKTVGREPTP